MFICCSLPFHPYSYKSISVKVDLFVCFFLYLLNFMYICCFTFPSPFLSISVKVDLANISLELTSVPSSWNRTCIFVQLQIVLGILTSNITYIFEKVWRFLFFWTEELQIVQSILTPRITCMYTSLKKVWRFILLWTKELRIVQQSILTPRRTFISSTNFSISNWEIVPSLFTSKILKIFCKKQQRL